MGKETKSGRKVKLVTGLNGKTLVGEWEILANGSTPALLGLPQMKSLGMSLKLGNTSCTISSELLGLYEEKVEEWRGHLVFNLADFVKKQINNMATGSTGNNLSGVVTTGSTSTGKGESDSPLTAASTGKEGTTGDLG